MAASFRTLPLVYAMMESQRCTEARHDVGRERMDFVTVVDQVLALLRRLSSPSRAAPRSAWLQAAPAGGGGTQGGHASAQGAAGPAAGHAGAGGVAQKVLSTS
jgi:hypothetical protein